MKRIFCLLIISIIILSGCSKKIEMPEDLDGYVRYTLAIMYEDRAKEKVVGIGTKDGEVIVSLNVDDGLTEKMVLSNILKESAQILEKLSVREDLKIITIAENAKLKDVYGKETDTRIFTLVMKKETLDKIVWDNFKYSNLPEIADLYEVHKSLK